MTQEDHQAEKVIPEGKESDTAVPAQAQSARQPVPSSRQKRRRAALLLLGGVTFLLIIGSAQALFPNLSTASTSTAFGSSSTGTPTARRSPVAGQSPQASTTPGHGTPAPGATAPAGTTTTIGPSPTSAPGTTPTTTSSPTATAPPSQLSVSPLSLQFSLTLVSCLTQQPSQLVTMKNTGGGTLTWQASLQNSAYLSIAPTSGILGAAQSTQMVVSLVCSAAPLHTTDSIYVTSNGGNLTISVTISLI